MMIRNDNLLKRRISRHKGWKYIFIQSFLYKQDEKQGQFNRFEFKVFFLDWLPYQGQIT